MTKQYIISECNDGRFVVQTPNQFGGLYPLISADADCRSSADCFAAIGENWLMGDMSREMVIKFLFKADPENTFTN